MDACVKLLRTFMSADLFRTRKSLGLSQADMAELLSIDLLSYSDLEHGKNLCQTKTFLFYLFRCKEDRYEFLQEIEKALQKLDDSHAV